MLSVIRGLNYRLKRGRLASVNEEFRVPTAAERKSRIVRNSCGRNLKMVVWTGSKDRSSDGEVNMMVSQSAGRFPDELV